MAKTITDELEELDVFAELDTKITSNRLHEELRAMYKAGQDPSCREGVHLSDIKGSETYRGKPNLCYRKIVLSAFYDPQPVLYGHPTVAHFERGTDMHKRWQEKFLRAGKIVYVQGVQGLEAVHEVNWFLDQSGKQRTDEDWRLLFTPDVIVDLGIGPEIVELKGYNTKHYVKLVKCKELPEAEDSYIQAQWYMWLSGIHQALVIVEHKDTQDFREWRIKFNPDVVGPYEQRIAKIDRLMEEYKTQGKLPPKICDAPDVLKARECGFCSVCFMGRSREALRKDKQ